MINKTNSTIIAHQEETIKRLEDEVNRQAKVIQMYEEEIKKTKTEYLKLIREKGEFDFEVSANICELSYDEYNELRSMLVVAIGTMEEMWRNNPRDVKLIKNRECIWK